MQCPLEKLLMEVNDIYVHSVDSIYSNNCTTVISILFRMTSILILQKLWDLLLGVLA